MVPALMLVESPGDVFITALALLWSCLGWRVTVNFMAAHQQVQVHRSTLAGRLLPSDEGRAVLSPASFRQTRNIRPQSARKIVPTESTDLFQRPCDPPLRLLARDYLASRNKITSGSRCDAKRSPGADGAARCSAMLTVLLLQPVTVRHRAPIVEACNWVLGATRALGAR